MAGISSLGIGSGVLSSDLVDKLVSAERKPTQDRLDFNQKRTEALISAYGKLRSAVTDLRLPLRQLSSPNSLKAFSASSTNDNVVATVDSKKASGGSYSVTVNSLAQSQSLASGTFSDKNTTTVGAGKLTLLAGSAVANITIDSSNNTLQGIADAINSSKSGVNAGIVDTGAGFRLVLSSEKSGLDNAITISVSDSDGANGDVAGLSQLAFNGTAKNLTETVAAADANVSINGIVLTRPTNTIDNVIDGLTLDVKAAGVTSTVSVSQDTGAVSDKVKAFVDKFNGLQSTIKDLAGYNAASGTGGLLSGDSTVRNVQNQLRSLLTRVVPGLENASVRSLADVGITTDFQTGQLTFDSAKFKSQLVANPGDVTALFAEQGRSSDNLVKYVARGDATQPGDYAINISQLATQGSLSGSNAGTASVTVDGTNDALTLQVDGTTTASILLTAGTYTRDQLAAEIQNQLDSNSALGAAGQSVKVAFNATTGSLEFNSTAYGSGSNVSITAVDTGTTSSLGLSVATGNAGKDVAGTIGGQAATGDGQLLTVNGNGTASGLQVKVTGGSVGARGTLSFIEGIGDRAVNLITDIVGASGSIENRTSGLQKELDKIAKERTQLDDRLSSYRARLVKQFSAADSLISQLNSTRDYITQQLAALAPQNSNN